MALADEHLAWCAHHCHGHFASDTRAGLFWAGRGSVHLVFPFSQSFLISSLSSLSALFMPSFDFPDIHGDPEAEVDRMRKHREITMSPGWIARQDRQMGVPPESISCRPPTLASGQLRNPRKLMVQAGPSSKALELLPHQRPPPRSDPTPPLRRSSSPSRRNPVSSPPSNEFEELPTPRKLLERGHDPRLPLTTSQPSSPRQESTFSPASSGGSSKLPTPRKFMTRTEDRMHATSPPCRAGHLCGLEDRDWDMERVIDRREVAGRVQYLVRWEDSKLDRRHIQTRADGSKYVCCQGWEWKIKSATELASRDLGGATYTRIVWQDSWNDMADLNGDEEGIDACDRMQTGTRSEATRQNPHRAIPPKRLKRNFRPRAGIDYGPAIRATMTAEPNKSRNVYQLLEATPLREVVFKDEFVETKRKRIDISRGSKRNAMLAHGSGHEYDRPCKRCRRERVPFRECVAGHNNVGSCTCCQFDEKGPACDFHTQRRQITGRSSLPDECDDSPTSSSPASSSALTPSTGGSRSSVAVSSESGYTEPTSPFEPTSSPSPVSSCSSSGTESLPARPLAASCTMVKSRQASCPTSELASSRTKSQTRAHRLYQQSATAALQRKRQRQHSIGQDMFDFSHAHSESQDGQHDSDERRRKSVKPSNDDSSAHASCPGGPEFCIAYQPRPLPPTTGLDSSSTHCTVSHKTVFQKGEATPAQVRFVLMRLSCGNADIFEKHWQAWRSHCRKEEKALRYDTKETYVADALWEELNQAVKHCPSRPSNVVYGLGSGPSRPIEIYDSD